MRVCYYVFLSDRVIILNGNKPCPMSQVSNVSAHLHVYSVHTAPGF